MGLYHMTMAWWRTESLCRSSPPFVTICSYFSSHSKLIPVCLVLRRTHRLSAPSHRWSRPHLFHLCLITPVVSLICVCQSAEGLNVLVCFSAASWDIIFFFAPCWICLPHPTWRLFFFFFFFFLDGCLPDLLVSSAPYFIYLFILWLCTRLFCLQAAKIQRDQEKSQKVFSRKWTFLTFYSWFQVFCAKKSKIIFKKPVFANKKMC